MTDARLTAGTDLEALARREADAYRAGLEAAKTVADRHHAMVGGDGNSEATLSDPVSEGYRNAAWNISCALSRLIAEGKP
jgi:hypothetical protein